jgi:hypothetical protein
MFHVAIDSELVIWWTDLEATSACRPTDSQSVGHLYCSMVLQIEMVS